ncbi:Glycosyltransferase involved in cell wall bisynthesis [Flavobacterium micromati]|uniref:Glycosyltransferase involved in cell wall bisynthesis n=1 Tax=Flavobacterium micromati TaxID=229205 RepID=A0A1M5K973_9FLAO|nr:glycosyltransferase [Flavobacterium micromati]SHG48713.1 Glycosyltransferase involved in cell wall bisynthesis [Flavobacterium micromati]
MEEKKKIVFLEAVQDYGGARISAVELADRLSRKHNVSIIDFYGSCKPFTEAVISKGLKLHIVEKRDTAYIINRSNNLIMKIINFLLFIPHLIRIRSKVHVLLKEIKPDYIILNNSKVLLSLAFFTDKKFKVLFFARGWFILSQITKLDRILYKILVDKYVCVANATKQALFCGGLTSLENLYVVHNAVTELNMSKEIASINKKENTKVILHAGGFLKDKGQLVSLEMAKILKERSVDFKLILAGLVYEGGESEVFYNKVKQIIIDYQLEDVVELVKNKPNVITYFNACDILIHPSETEGLPRVIMEAMILKKPVIANAVGGVCDYILNEFTGFLPQHNSSEEYASFVQKLIADKILYDFVSFNAYNLVKTSFTEENQLKSLDKVFNS